MRKVIQALTADERRLLVVVTDISIALFAAGLMTAIVQFVLDSLF